MPENQLSSRVSTVQSSVSECFSGLVPQRSSCRTCLGEMSIVESRANRKLTGAKPTPECWGGQALLWCPCCPLFFSSRERAGRRRLAIGTALAK